MINHIGKLAAAPLVGAVALIGAPAHAAVIFGANTRGVVIISSASATAKARDSATAVSKSGNQQQSAATLPTVPLVASASASANDASASAGINEDVTATFASAASGTVTFTGVATASNPQVGGTASTTAGTSFEYFFGDCVVYKPALEGRASVPMLGAS